MQRSIVFLLAVLLYAGQLSAGDETRSSRVYANQLVSGAFIQTHDDKYAGLPPTGYANYTNRGVVEFGLDEDKHSVRDEYALRATFKVAVTDIAGTVTIYNEVLNINYDPDEQTRYKDRAQRVYVNAYKLRVYDISIYRCNLSTPETSPCTTAVYRGDDVYLQAEIMTNRLYDFTFADALGSGQFSHQIVSATNELRIDWGYLKGAEEYELEYTWVDDYASGSALLQSNIPFDLEHDATRVVTPYTQYRIPLTYERGYIWYRIRPIGRSSTNQRMEGAWYGAPAMGPSTTLFAAAVAPLNADALNWSGTKTFAELGLTGTGVQALDALGKPRQSLARLNTDQKTIAQSTLYDFYGRPAVNILPAPVTGLDLNYRFNLNVYSGGEFEKSDFDQINSSNVCLASSLALDQSASLGAAHYYSPQNPERESFQGYVPDADGLPYTQIKMRQDALQKPTVQTLPGVTHQLGSGREMKYFYSKPTQVELDRLFGTEAPRAAHCYKNYALDPNGQISVTYIDQDGRTIATALAGNAPPNVDQLPGLPSSSLFTDDMITPTSNYADPVEKCYEVNTSFFIADANTPADLLYQASIGEFGSECLSGLCFDCVYSLQISIRNDCGEEVFDYNASFDPGFDDLIGAVPPYQGGVCNGASTYLLPGSAINTPITINFARPGTYSLYKKLCVSDAPLDDYTQEYLKKQTCVDPCSYVNDIVANTDFSHCTPQTCADCNAKLAAYQTQALDPTYRGKFDNYGECTDPLYTGPLYPMYSSQQISEWEERCAALCQSNSSCDKLERRLLSDFYPGTGQYASTDPSSSGWSGSIMNPANTVFGGYNWTTPASYHTASGSFPDAVQINGTGVLPQDLSAADYQYYYRKSWAGAFLPQHPEYCKMYFYCNVLGASMDYDEKMKNITHYDSVCTSTGFIFPTGTLPGTVIAPPASACAAPAVDPIFTSLASNVHVIAFKDELLNNLFTNTSQSIYHYVTLQFYTTLPGSYNFGQDECSRDAMWEMFRSIYLTKKQLLYNKLYQDYLANPSSFGYSGSCSASAPAGFRTQFPQLGDRIDDQIPAPPSSPPTSSLIDAMGATADGSAATSLGSYLSAADSGTNAAHSASTCADYVDLWQRNLQLACPAYAAAGSVVQNNILTALQGVCRKGCDMNSPDGASTVPTGNPYLIMPGSVPVNSFQEVLDYYLGTNACAATLIDYPGPYPLNVATQAGNQLSSCHCDQVLKVSADFATMSAGGTLPAGVTEEWQLFRQQNGYDLSEYYMLKCFCNQALAQDPLAPAWTAPGYAWTNTQLSAIASFPASVNSRLTCSSCLKCSEVVTAVDALTLPVNPGLPTKAENIRGDSTNTYYVLSFLNQQFGRHALDYYLDLYNDCQSFNSGGSTAFTFANNISPEAFDLFAYLNQLVTLKNLQSSGRSLSLCQDDKYYLSSLYTGSLPTINALTYNFGIVGSTLTFNIQAPGPVNLLSVALTLPGSYAGSWADLVQLNNFVAWCPSPAAGPNYGFKVNATDANLNTVTLQGQITNMAFPVCNLSAAPSPQPMHCPAPQPSKNSCAAARIADALVQGKALYEQQQQQLAAEFQDQYKTHCFESVSESFTREYLFLKEYNYTLYYYDRAGNLQRTVPPEGVEPLSITTNLSAATYPQHADNTTYQAENYASDYRFNSRNQPVREKTVDGGETRYLYDLTGRIIASQNAKQAAITLDYVYSYTLYDNLGRISETGEMYTTTNLFATPGVHSMAYSSFAAVVAAAVSTQQVTKIFYDDLANITLSSGAAAYFALPGNAPEHLRNRVAAITYVEIPVSTSYEHATFYSYDEHGNVSSVIQENHQLPSTLSGSSSGYNMQMKRVDYSYDLVSGNMLQATYQGGQPDHFTHKYLYDADNRLHEVFTTRDGINWDRDAKYFYYAHGPLARIERADRKVQGTDYYYTIHGWLKGVNSDVLDMNRDAGKDGAATNKYLSNYDKIHAYFAKDAMSFALNYYNNTAALATNVDYKAVKNGDYNGSTDMTPLSDLSNLYNNTAPFYLDYNGTGDGASLFNGNISSMVTSFIDKNSSGNTWTNNTPFPQLTAYRYDQLHRITAQKAHRARNGNVWSQAVSGTNYYGAYQMGLSYDRNGNILSLLRNGADGALVSGASLSMDNLQYRYKTILNSAATNNNQLYGVFDAVTGSAYTDDIETPASTPATYNGSTDHYAYDEIGNLIKDKGEYIASIDWTVDRKVQRITRNATAMLATGTGIGSVYKPDIEYVYNGSRQRVIKIVKPRDQVTKQVRPSNEWLYTYYVYDATGKVMAVYDRKTTTVDGHYRDAVGLAEQHIYGSNRLALMRPSSPVEWSYYYTPCGGEGEGSECRTIITSAVPGGAPTAAGRWLGYKEFELSNHLGNVIATVSDREVTELSATLDQFTGSTNGWGGAGVSGTGTQLQLNTTTAYTDAMEKTITTVPGHSYRIRYTLINPNGLAVEGEAYPVPVVPPFLVNVPASVNTEFIFTATTTQTKLRIQRGVDAVGSSWFRIDDVWIEEVSGYAADLLMHTDYYAFGQQMPGRQWVASDYRYAFNGKEKLYEAVSGEYDYGARILDSRIGRWLTWDPLRQKYPTVSPYIYGLDNPIAFRDPDGNDIVDANGNKVEVKLTSSEGKYKVDFAFKEGTDQKTKDQFNANAKPVIESMTKTEIGREVVAAMNESKTQISITVEKKTVYGDDKGRTSEVPKEGYTRIIGGETSSERDSKGGLKKADIKIYEGSIEKIQETKKQSDNSKEDLVGTIGVHEGTHATDKESNIKTAKNKNNVEKKPIANQLKHQEQLKALKQHSSSKTTEPEKNRQKSNN